jgi:plastocyanin
VSAFGRIRSAAVFAAIGTLALPAVPAGGAEGATINDPIVGFTYGFGTPALYAPAQAIRVEVGTTIRWTNFDPVAHDVTFEDGSSQVFLKTGESTERTFDTRGRYAFHCHTHADIPIMYGLVYVD